MLNFNFRRIMALTGIRYAKTTTTLDSSENSTEPVDMMGRPLPRISLSPDECYAISHPDLENGIFGSMELLIGKSWSKQYGVLIKMRDVMSYLYFLHDSGLGGGPTGIKFRDKTYKSTWLVTKGANDSRNFIPHNPQPQPQKQTINTTYIENPFTTPIKLNEYGYIYLNGPYLKHKDGNDSLNGKTRFLIQSICPNIIKRYCPADSDSPVWYDLFQSQGAKMSSHTLSLPLSIQRQGIGDCGYGALSGVDSIVALSELRNNPPTRNFRLLQFFTILESGLGNAGYLISSVKLPYERLNAVEELRILQHIGKLSNCLVPILNPHMNDHELKNPYGRSRYFILITHAGLKLYYQSEEFKALNLQI